MINCPTSDELELAFCLQGKDAAELAEKQAQIFVRESLQLISLTNHIFNYYFLTLDKELICVYNLYHET